MAQSSNAMEANQRLVCSEPAEHGDSPRLLSTRHFAAWRRTFCFSLAAAALLWLGGLGHRMVIRRADRLMSQKAGFPFALSRLALDVEPWQGRDVPLPSFVTNPMKTDAYLCRRYENVLTREAATLFVTVTSQPRTMLGHRPEICYPAVGWIREQTVTASLAAGGKVIPYLLHCFSTPDVVPRRLAVLAFYVVNGETTIDEGVFRSVRWRAPHAGRGGTCAILQVQVVVPVRSTQEFAERTARDFVRVFAKELVADLATSL